MRLKEKLKAQKKKNEVNLAQKDYVNKRKELK